MNKDLSPLQQELLTRADTIFLSIGDVVGKASTFAAEQIPDIALQYVAYGRVISTMTVVVGLTLLIIGLWLIIRVAVQDCYKSNGEYENRRDMWSEVRTGAMLVGVMLAVVGFLVSAINMAKFVMVWFAPKIWLMIEIVHLVKR